MKYKCIGIVLCALLISCKPKSSFEDPFIMDLGDNQQEVFEKYKQIKKLEGQEKLCIYCLTTNGYKLTLPKEEASFYDALPYDSLYKSKTWMIHQLHDFGEDYNLLIEFDDSCITYKVSAVFKESRSEASIFQGYMNIYKTELTHSSSYSINTDDKGHYLFTKIEHGVTSSNYVLTRVDKETALKLADRIDKGELGFEHAGLEDAGSDIIDIVLDAL